MEIRSSRRLRTLVTQMALRGLSANEIAGALIPMMARARRSNQRPDTLMQDRYRQLDEILLLRTAGPYIRVIRVDFAISARMSGYPPVHSTGQCNTSRSLSAGVSKPKVFRGR